MPSSSSSSASALRTSGTDPSNNNTDTIVSSFRTNEYETLLEQKLIPLYEQKQQNIRTYQQQLNELVPLRHKTNDLIQHIYIQEGLAASSSSSSSSIDTSTSSSPLSSSSSDSDNYTFLVDIGQGYRIPAIIPHPSFDTTTVSIDIGCNIYIEMKLLEAQRYLNEQIKDLETIILSNQNEMIRIGSDIQLATAGLETIQEEQQKHQGKAVAATKNPAKR